MSTRGLKFNYQVGELVLCFEPDPTKARVLYDAKVLEGLVTNDKDGKRMIAYHIHFQGWNSGWDRIVGENYILKNNIENRNLMRQLAETSRKYRKNNMRRRRIDTILKDAFNGTIPVLDGDSENNSSDDDDDDDEDGQDGEDNMSESSEDTETETRERKQRATHTPVNIEIPEILKLQLENDYIFVNQKRKLNRLPASPNVIEILERFMKTFCVHMLCESADKKDDRSSNGQDCALKSPPMTSISLCKELVDGLRIAFDFTLPLILLYRTEREQYDHIIKTIKHSDLAKEEKPPVEEPTPKKMKMSPRHLRNDDKPTVQEEKHKVDTKHSVNEKHEERIKKRTDRHSRQDEEEKSPEMSPRRVTRHSVHFDSPSTKEDILKAVSNLKTPEKADVRTSTKKFGGFKRKYRKHGSSTPGSVKSEVREESCELMNGVGSSSSPVEQVVVGNKSSSLPVTARNGYGSEGSSDVLDSVLSWQLYPQEFRKQYNIMPSQIYGASHLLRLFVKLPEILNKMDMEESKMQVLMKLIYYCLRYLVERQEELFNDLPYIDHS